MCPKKKQQRFTAVALKQWRFCPAGDLRPCLSQLGGVLAFVGTGTEAANHPAMARKESPHKKGSLSSTLVMLPRLRTPELQAVIN